MPKYNSYPYKASPENGDTVLIYDATGNKNKQTYFSNFFSWVFSTLRGSDFTNLATTSKTIEGAINEVNTRANTTDTTLSVSGDSADAQATGDAISGLETAFTLTDAEITTINGFLD